MAKLKISDYSSTSAGANLNTDINSIDIDEGCAPSGINNAIRTLMAQLKDFQTGVSGDSLTLGGALSGTSATFSGNITASAISGASLTLSGNVTASAISGASMTLSGDLTVDTDTLYVDSTNNRVGIGTSSPLGRFSVLGGSRIVTIGDSGTANTPAITVRNTTDTSYSFFNISTYQTRFFTEGLERMRIDNSGNVGIGTSSPANKLHVNSVGSDLVAKFESTDAVAYISLKDSSTSNDLHGIGAFANNLLLYSNNAERMRIDSSGNVLVGKATTGITGNGFTAQPNANGAGIPGSWLTGNSTNDAHGGYHMYSSASSSYKFYATYAGKVYAVTTTIQGISDQRLKENIEDIDVGLQQILALKPRKFDWKKGKGKDIKGDRGWIAQEFEQVFPEMVDTWKDPAPEGEEPYKSVGADLIPVLVKAIQELKAELDAVKSELNTLKGN